MKNYGDAVIMRKCFDGVIEGVQHFLFFQCLVWFKVGGWVLGAHLGLQPDSLEYSRG